MPPYHPPKRALNGGVPYLQYIIPCIVGCGIASVQVLARNPICRASLHGKTLNFCSKYSHHYLLNNIDTNLATYIATILTLAGTQVQVTAPHSILNSH